MFTRIKSKIYRNFGTSHKKGYNWGVIKKNRITRKSWQEQNKKNLEKKINNINLDRTHGNKNKHSNFPVDLNTVNNWKLKPNRDIFLL